MPDKSPSELIAVSDLVAAESRLNGDDETAAHIEALAAALARDPFRRPDAISERERLARQACVLILWAAAPGSKMNDAARIMEMMSVLWPGDDPLTIDALPNAPSADLWRRVENGLAALKATTT